MSSRECVTDYLFTQTLPPPNVFVFSRFWRHARVARFMQLRDKKVIEVHSWSLLQRQKLIVISGAPPTWCARPGSLRPP
jgi:hypothetical protein